MNDGHFYGKMGRWMRENRDTAWRVLDIVLSISLVSVLGVVAFNTRMLISHGNQIAAINGNRFTSQDGLAIWKEIAQIREELATLPREVPPKWFVDRVDKIERALETIENEIRLGN